MLPAATRPILLRLPSFSSKVPFFSLFPPFFFAKIAVCLVDVLLWYPKNANSVESVMKNVLGKRVDKRSTGWDFSMAGPDFSNSIFFCVSRGTQIKFPTGEGGTNDQESMGHCRRHVSRVRRRAKSFRWRKGRNPIVARKQVTTVP